MKPWTYRELPLDVDSLFVKRTTEESIGFIYKITNTVNGKIYIGRKSFTASKKTAIGKRAMAKMVDKRGSKTKTVVKTSNWQLYTGSNKQLNEDIKNGDDITREIIHLCFTKKQMTYWELFYQMQYDVLRSDSYNDNILGKFFRADLLNKATNES